MKEKVVVGMSGGVDSSVAAYLLKQQGYDVIGVTMQIWQDENADTVAENAGCCGLSAVADARRIADSIGIPYYVMNFKNEFKQNVIEYFVQEYKKGRTPNPCIACNRYVKWESLLERSLSIGAEYIATGHYAKIEKLDNGRYAIRKAKTDEKDQTYALYNLSQAQLARTLFPIGEYTKPEIRQIAKDISLRIANKPDSQEICFIPDNDYAKFIEQYTGDELAGGNFVDLAGNVLGKHKGIIHYTIGQRKGLNLNLGKKGFVVDINTETLDITIGDNQDAFARGCIANQVNLMAVEDLVGTVELTGKVRYNQAPARCRVRRLESGELECLFENKQRAITKGQALVLYDQDLVVGGGTIDRILR